MTRGIHLKELSTTDLSALGLERREASVPTTSVLAETDPALSKLVGEVRHGLETTLALLDEALRSTRAE
jgi:hypothetical protein